MEEVPEPQTDRQQLRPRVQDEGWHQAAQYCCLPPVSWQPNLDHVPAIQNGRQHEVEAVEALNMLLADDGKDMKPLVC